MLIFWKNIRKIRTRDIEPAVVCKPFDLKRDVTKLQEGRSESNGYYLSCLIILHTYHL